MVYSVVEEASEATVCYTDNLQEAIEEAKTRQGKHLVLNEYDGIEFDSQPNVSYKI